MDVRLPKVSGTNSQPLTATTDISEMRRRESAELNELGDSPKTFWTLHDVVLKQQATLPIYATRTIERQRISTKHGDPLFACAI